MNHDDTNEFDGEIDEAADAVVDDAVDTTAEALSFDDATDEAELPEGATELPEVEFEGAAEADFEIASEEAAEADSVEAPELDEPVAAATESETRWEDTTTAPPPPAAVPVETRLVRDPHATFGGVISGIAHRYGWDVAVTRLAFVVLLFASGGLMIPVYLLSWLIIPRATYWPPFNARFASGRLSMREVALGLVAAGILIALAAGGGTAGAIIVPLALVGGGVWMLFQPPREEVAVAAGATNFAAAGAPAPVTAPQAAAPQAPAYAPPAGPVGQPVQPRSRGRRFFTIGLVGALALFFLAIIAVPLIIIAAVVGSGEINFEGGGEVVYMVDNGDFPLVIDSDAGDVTVDLRSVDIDELNALPEPAIVNVDLGFGVVTVLVPEDLEVDVDAEVGLGDVMVFGRNESGVSNDVTITNDDAGLELQVDVGAGEIDIVRRTALAG